MINNHRSFCSISTQPEPQLSHICKATLLTSIRLKVLQSILSLSGSKKWILEVQKVVPRGKKTSLKARAFYNLQWVVARDGHTDAATRAKFTKSRRNCGHPRPRQLKRRFRSPSVSEKKVLIRFWGETKIKETLWLQVLKHLGCSVWKAGGFSLNNKLSFLNLIFTCNTVLTCNTVSHIST